MEQDEQGRLDRELLTAVGHQDVPLTRDLLDRGANADAVDEKRTSALHRAAAAWSEGAALATLLLDRGARINVHEKWGKTPLHVAADQGLAGVAGLLIDRGAEINARDDAQLTPLHWAVERDRRDVVELLVARGADVSAGDYEGETPLGIAERNGWGEIATFLKAHGAAGGRAGEPAKSFVGAEADRKAGAARSAEQTVADVLALVKGHRGDDAQLESALANYFGARVRSALPPHPRVNPTGPEGVAPG